MKPANILHTVSDSLPEIEPDPLVSVIVPAFDAEAFLVRVLSAVQANDYSPKEIIVVDDGSTDRTGEIAQRMATQVVRMPGRTSAARARNAGAQKSTGPILFFIDADVEIPPDAIARVVGIFRANPDIQALFGSYSDRPTAPDYFSQYRNLLHHYVHQHAVAEACTFWGGCGAIRREAFVRGGGFPERYRGASIEDVELGLRLSNAGGRICLVKTLQVKHLKKWTLGSILYTDIFQRAVPWTSLAWEHGLPDDLNFKITDRTSAMCVWLLAGSLLAGIRWNPGWFIALLCAVALLAMNRKLYSFFCRKKGVVFGAGAVLMHWLYLFYSSVTFAICSVPQAMGRFRAKRRT